MSLKTGLVSYWSLEESSGDRIDRKGVNNLAPSGSPGSTTGKIGSAAELNATTKFLSCSANSFQPGSGDFTFSGWFRLTATISVGQAFLAGNYNSDAINNRGWGLQIQYISPTNALFRCFVSSAGTAATTEIMGDTEPGSDRVQTIFRHWVLRKIGSALVFFLDGVSYATATLASVFAPAEPFRINGMGKGNQANSIIADECGYWNRGLSNDEIALLWNGGNGLGYNAFGGGIIPILRQHYAAQGAR